MAGEVIEAVKQSKPYLLEKLLKSGADVNEADHLGYTPLIHFAIDGKMVMIGDILLRHKPNLNALNIERKTALMYAAARGSSLTKKLIDAGADVDIVDEHGHAALFFALEGGHKHVARLLDVKGAKVSSKTEFDLLIANIRLAADHDGPEDRIPNVLASVHTKNLVNMKDKDGCTPLMIAPLRYRISRSGDHRRAGQGRIRFERSRCKR